MFNVRLYKSTGFNTIDIPDSPALLEQYNYIDVDPVDILQDGFLSSVTVRAKWNDIKDCDYAKVGDYYYSIPAGIYMTSTDVAVIPLVIDYICSIGGIANINILSGLSDRLSGDVNDDGYDPYISPRLPLLMESEWVEPSDVVGEEVTYIESSIDLYAMGDSNSDVAVTYTDGTTTHEVTVPKTTPCETQTIYHMREVLSGNFIDNDIASTQLFAIRSTDTPEKQQLLAGIEKARSLGVEGAITNKVKIPYKYVAPTYDATGVVVTHMTGASGTIPTTVLVKNYSNDVVNTEIMHTDVSSYNIMSGTGETLSVAPLLINEASDTAPSSLYYKVDPHTDGRIYYGFFKYMSGNPTEEELWRNMIGGFQWQQIPLVFNQVSGSAINQKMFSLSLRSTNTSINQNIENRALEAELNKQAYDITEGTAVAESVASGLTLNVGGATGALGKSIGGWLDYVNDEKTSALRARHVHDQLRNQRSAEATAYGLKQYSCIVPGVSFPYNTNMVRDFLGNGCFVYRYKMRQADLTRLDRIITAFGHSITKEMENADLHKCQYFDYVSASVTIYGNSRWLNEGIALQLNSGVRIWHVQPNKSYILNRNNPLV